MEISHSVAVRWVDSRSCVTVSLTDCRSKWLHPRPWELTFSNLWRDCDTHPVRQTSTAGIRERKMAARTVRVILLLCLSAITCVSLIRPGWLSLLLMTSGPWDQASCGPRPPFSLFLSLTLCATHTHAHVATSYTPLDAAPNLADLGSVSDCVCVMLNVAVNSEGKLAVWKLALSLVYMCITSRHAASDTYLNPINANYRGSFCLSVVSSFRLFPPI